MRLVDANKLVKSIIEERNKIPLTMPCAPYELLDVKPNAAGQNQRGGIRKALRCVEEAPTIDAVPVVRCKDCKHFGGVVFAYTCRLHSGPNTRIQMNENDFCSHGERREDI